MSTATQLINDGNTSGTQIVEATVSGDTTSAVMLRNNGTLVLGNSSHHGTVSLDNATITTDGSGNVANVGLTVNGNISITGNTTLKSGSTNQIGTTAIRTFSAFTFTSTGANQTVNHGYSGTPATIIIVPSGTTPSQSITDITNITSTSFTANNNGGIVAGVTFNGIAIG